MTSDIDPILASRLDRRDFLRYAAILGGAGVLAACKKAVETTPPAGGSASASPRPSVDQEPGILKVFDWDGYGNDTYGDHVLWKAYAKKYPDQKPKFILFKDDDFGYAQVANGARYDVVHPCAYRWPDWINLDVLQPWDTSLISNFGDLNPAFVEGGKVNGRQYFVPLDWGFAAPMYRADKVQPIEDSWGLLWDERYKGRISWWDSLNMFIVAGYFNGVANPWDMTDQELQAQKEFLISKIPLVRALWPVDPTPDVLNGDIWITYAWPVHWWAAKDYGSGKGLDVVYMNPKEGRTSWNCGMALFKDTPNYYHAHDYVDAWASAASALWLVTNDAYGHTNTTLDLSKVPQELVDAFSLDDPTALEEPHSHVERPIRRRDVYNQLWGEVKAAG